MSAIAAGDALWRHTCRFTAPLEIVTDFGSQFMNHLNAETGIKHHTTIPYSEEENEIVERANKEVNRHIRNILFDKGHFKNWSRLHFIAERVLTASVKVNLRCLS